MSSGPEHYRAAEGYLARAEGDEPGRSDEFRRDLILAAQAHATLALTASNIEAATRRPSAEWSEVVA
jgi:hypothetical protein